MYNDDDGDWDGSNFVDIMFVLGGAVMIVALTTAAYYAW